MVSGKAICIHPLACATFNSDFDGYQIARRELKAEGHILGPKNGKFIITSSQNMLIGIYYLSSEVANSKMNNLCNINEAFKA